MAWWNLENMFDYAGSPRRTDKLRRAIGADLTGWTPQLRDRKLDRLASVIVSMNGGLGPDLLGVCEIENRWVLERLCDRLGARLAHRSYSIIHADTSDQRGIDVAFIYERSLLRAPESQVFQHVVMRRTATREILQVNFVTHRRRTLTVSEITGPRAEVVSRKLPHIEPLRAKRCRTFINERLRSTAMRHRPRHGRLQ